MKYISILGSTGSIGTQALDVVRGHSDKIKVAAISGNTNI
jgi:1-deoxy-D-xylulose-5-phosphate reductoisomerase